MNSPGRNDPCPCGSGKKFKKCCGKAASIATPLEVARASHVKSLDSKLFDRLMKFSRTRFNHEWLSLAITMYNGFRNDQIEELDLQLAIPWAVFHFPLPGLEVSVAEIYARENGTRLPSELRSLFNAQLDAWLSIWEVKDVERNVGLRIVDRLTGEERFVHEVKGTEFMDLRTAVLGRVVDADGISFFSGVHPQPLPPREAEIMVREAKRLCRVRTRPAKKESLRDPVIQVMMIEYWRWMVGNISNRPRPTLTNTDGDLISLTTDHFDIVSNDRSEVLARLASIRGAREPEPDEHDTSGVSMMITKPDDTIVGTIRIHGHRLRAESNSIERADALRAAIEAHAGELVRHRIREETNLDLSSEDEESSTKRKPAAASPQTDEMIEIARAYKERHMAQWPDMEIPALGGMTPREAAKDPRARKELDLLLREMEMHESRLPENEQFDMAKLRESLGMPDSE
ncbi:MAG TPA: SEC-C metal-binding domain-containing protein [Gemmatimonadaceae bacterium]